MTARSNDEWLLALREPPGEAQSSALSDLSDFLLRAALVYLSQHRSELTEWNPQDVHDFAEDMTQEALLEVQASLNTFKGDSKFTTWAYRFVINQAASELRRKHYRNLSLEGLLEQEPAVFQTLLAERAEPEQLVERRSYLALLREIIETELSERQRAALVGVVWLGHSMTEVADGLGVSRNALYKLLYDARQQIKARLLDRHLTENDILAAFEE